MARLKRWSTQVMSRIDQMVTQIENHEGMVTSALKDVQRAAARAKVQLARVQEDGQRMQRELESQREAAESWRRRALAAAEKDEQKGLECLRRSKRATANLGELDRRLEEHGQVEQRLLADVGKIEERLTKLKQQRNVLRTRQSRAEALSSTQDVLSPGDLDLGDLFDRWETRVTEAEIEGGVTLDSDDVFEGEFIAREEEESLRAELAELARLAQDPEVQPSDSKEA